MPNRLAKETSPYLQQHKDNPVDWYPWGDEAFERARKEDRPILLSIGYSACHWCHVMEHESFANEATAALMNESFVNIKVDREERPDVDSLYMQAVQQISGHGGWPMTVFLTPDGSPFYGGTYYPPEPRHGLPSFRQLLSSIRDAYTNRRSEVDDSAGKLVDFLARGMAVKPPASTLSADTVRTAFQRLAARFDPQHGGFGGAPKFPQPMLLEFLLVYWRVEGNEDALKMVTATLDRMAAGGIRDHLGGGFHRYSVDARWLVPHFEKMLYDNAQLAAVYSLAYQATGEPYYRQVAEETLDFVLREMTSPEGGFYSSQDADSEGVEGKFYVWSAAEIAAALGPDLHPWFAAEYDVSEAGNWEGVNILNRLRQDAFPSSGNEDSAKTERARAALLRIRNARIAPGRDDKVIASWNGMMIRAFAIAGRAFDREDYINAAARASDFVLTHMMTYGRLLRSWRQGDARIDAFLEDHALMVTALLETYQSSFDLRWLDQAVMLADTMIERFWDEEQQAFLDTHSGSGDLPIRPRDIHDNATPAGTSAAVQALIQLGRLSGEPSYERTATRVLETLASLATEIPQGFGNLLSALQHHLQSPTEVVIVGDGGSEDTNRMLGVVKRRYLPHTSLAFLDTGRQDHVQRSFPLFEGRAMKAGKATGYVCRHYTCKQPVTEPGALELDLMLIEGGHELP